MTDTISQPASPLEDIRVQVARRVLAELPEAGDNEEPYYWIGRLKTAMKQLLAVAAPTPGGLDARQREVLATALADASVTSAASPGGAPSWDARSRALAYQAAANDTTSGPGSGLSAAS